MFVLFVPVPKWADYYDAYIDGVWQGSMRLVQWHNRRQN